MADRDATTACKRCLGDGYATCQCDWGAVMDDARFQPHPTTPTPEPACDCTMIDTDAWACRDCGKPVAEPVASVGEVTAEEAREALGDAHAAASPARRDRGFMIALRYIAQTAALRSEIADLRGKLERVERERVDALSYALDVVGERDAATSRATELERLLRESYEHLVKRGPPGDYACEECQPGSPMLKGDGWQCMYHRARKHLSTLPGSKESE